MAIYKLVGDKEKLAKVDPTSFGQEGMLERSDLQRLLRDQPQVLEEGLLIISEEFGNWQDSNRRIDLLGLDAEGRLVVVELKRGETGNHMDLQAIRYAAMVANMTFGQAVDTYQDYLEKRSREEGSGDEPEDAESRLREHLTSNDQDELVIHTEVPRIILASENFGKELTTCVMWLNDSWLKESGHEIKCVRLQPHRNGSDILIETSVVIPLPEPSDYRTRLGQWEQETRSKESGRIKTIQAVDVFVETPRDRVVMDYINLQIDAVQGPAEIDRAKMMREIPIPKSTLDRALRSLREQNIINWCESRKGRRGPRIYYRPSDHTVL